MNKQNLENIIQNQKKVIEELEHNIDYWTRTSANAGSSLSEYLKKRNEAEKIIYSAEKDLKEGKFDKDEL